MTNTSFPEVFSIAHRLNPGRIEKEHLSLLIDISTIRSEKIINALYDYFISGNTRTNICEKYKVNPGIYH